MKIRNARAFPCTTTLGTQPPDRPFLTIIVKGTFALVSSAEPARPLSAQLPIEVADRPYDPARPAGLLELENDLAPFKPRADIVLVGHAYPTGRSASACDVHIQVGRTQKTLRVVGERKWSCPTLSSIPTQLGPLAFERIPLTYDRAFGGSDEHANVTSPINPLGRGLVAQPTVQSIHGRDLPNIEDPEDMIEAWDSYPRPAGCGFFPRGSSARRRYLGTYDHEWQSSRAPNPPDDFAFDFYNGAHPDLQVAGFLQGNELVTLNHVRPGGRALNLQLPCIEPIISVEIGANELRADAPRRGSYAVTTHLDTAVFLPDDERFYLVWRGTFPLTSIESLEDITQVRIDYRTLPQPTVHTRVR